MSTTTLRTQDGIHYLTAELNGDVVADRDDADLGAWQDWEVGPDPYGDPAVRTLKSCHGKYLSAYSRQYCEDIGVPQFTVKATAEYVDIWERWRCVRDGDIIRFQSCWGLWLSPQNIDDDHPQAGGAGVLCNGPEPAGWETFFPSDMAAFGMGTPPITGGAVRLLEGQMRVLNRSFADQSGARLVHGTSDFVAMAKFHEDRDTYLRNLDTTAKWQQFTRLGWRVNGWVFDERGLAVDPYKYSSWWEDALRGVLAAHRDRGLKVKISSFDMNDWTDNQAMESFKRTAAICAEYGDTVWASCITNEMQGTWRPGETDENVARARELMQAWVKIYPGGLQALSDPRDRDKTGMKKLAWTMALVHQFGQPIDVGIRRAFNDPFENYPGFPIDQDEPRGPNGPNGGDVTSPVEDPDKLFGLYTMHVLTGQSSTYFNNPGCAARLPLDSTWGFKELPQLWRMLEIPEDIGQGQLCAGHHNTFMQVNDSHASRADGMRIRDYGLGVISGEEDGQPWKVRADYAATWSVWYADSVTTGRPAWEGRLSGGQAIPTPRGFTPAVVRALE